MTLDEVIAYARKEAQNLKKKVEGYSDKPYDFNSAVKKKCLERAKEHEQLASWLEELKARREADEWISVNDKLPEKEGRCLVFTDYGDVTMDSYIDGMFVCNLGNVTHWRPLPKAPESEAK